MATAFRTGSCGTSRICRCSSVSSTTAPPRYTELLKAAYPAIKALQPNSTVIAGGLSPALAPDAPPIFVNAMYDSGAKGYFDAMAMHPVRLPDRVGLADPLNGWSDVEVVRQIMVDRGDGDKKIWMTELGASTSDPAGRRCQPGRAGPPDHRRAAEGRAIGIQRACVHLRDPRRRFHPARQPRRQLRGAADLGLAAQGGGRGAGKVDRRRTAGSSYSCESTTLSSANKILEEPWQDVLCTHSKWCVPRS